MSPASPRRRDRPDEAIALEDLIENHHQHTGSRVAREILADWETERLRFWVLVGAPGPSQDLEAGHEGTVDEVDRVAAAGQRRGQRLEARRSGCSTCVAILR